MPVARVAAGRTGGRRILRDIGLAEEQLRALIDAGGAIVAELDLDAVLGRVLDAALQLTGARYAALGVLDESRTGLERFITRGLDAETERAIGPRPHGRGVLGVLISDPRPLRLAHVADHPDSYGFPPGHPPMQSFLGVPIMIRGEAWGNLYLTDKPGEFGDGDEEAIVVLAGWAAIAIDNARLYAAVADRSRQLERAVTGLAATQAIALAVGTEPELERILQLICDQARMLVRARSVVIMLREGDELAVAALAGDGTVGPEARVPIEGSTSGDTLLSRRLARIGDAATEMRYASDRLGVRGARTALLAPLVHQGVALGVLAAFDHHGFQVAEFGAEDERALETFAASAATAVSMARSVQQQRLRDALAAAESERRRWARELHDETLQALGGLRMLLSSAQRAGRADALPMALEMIEQEITNLRALITELRPAALDELGLEAALEALLDRHRAVNGLEVSERLELPVMDADAQATVYRVVQEALNNVAKHSGAGAASVRARVEDGELVLEVADDGRGFDVEHADGGFGLIGMRERVLACGGELAIDSSPAGSHVVARLPLADSPQRIS